MLLYHGTDFRSAKNIRKHGIDISKGGWNADFGLGFYLATQKGVAKGRANQASFRTRQRGAIMAYELDTEGLFILKPNLMEWENIVLGFRMRGMEFEKELPNHDGIIGPIADGKIAVMSEMLASNLITEAEFCAGLKTKLPGLQIALKTEKAIEALVFREESVL